MRATAGVQEGVARADKTSEQTNVKMLLFDTYRRRLGNRRLVLMPGMAAIGVTLHSGVVNCRRFEPPPLLRFKIGVVDDIVPDNGRWILLD